MKQFNWNPEKNEKLKQERGVSFEDVVSEIVGGGVLADTLHPSRANQRLFVVLINDYVHLVPYVQEGDEVFFKTIIPSRKATKHYREGMYEKKV